MLTGTGAILQLLEGLGNNSKERTWIKWTTRDVHQNNSTKHNEIIFMFYKMSIIIICALKTYRCIVIGLIILLATIRYLATISKINIFSDDSNKTEYLCLGICVPLHRLLWKRVVLSAGGMLCRFSLTYPWVYAVISIRKPCIRHKINHLVNQICSHTN